MKRLFLLLLMLPLTFVSCDELGEEDQYRGWTVETIPNTRLKGNDIHVSDPDGYLSDGAERMINQALSAIRSQADVFLVTVTAVDAYDTKTFATKLFNHWGIGDAETNNGVLLLFVEEPHALEFETGYGAEAVLTDAKCERIFNTIIKPYFIKGEYEEGLCAAAGAIVDVYGGEVPLGLMSNVGALTGEEGEDLDDYDGLTDTKDTSIEHFRSEPHSLWGLGFVVPIMFLVLSFYPLFAFRYAKKEAYKKEDKDKKINEWEEASALYVHKEKGMESMAGCLSGFRVFYLAFWLMMMWFLFGFLFSYTDFQENDVKGGLISVLALVVARTLVSWWFNKRVLAEAEAGQERGLKKTYRNLWNGPMGIITTIFTPWVGMVMANIYKKRIKSGEELCPKCGSVMHLKEQYVLPMLREKEKELKAFEFAPYRCEAGHDIVLVYNGKDYGKLKECEKCGGHLMQSIDEKILVKATYSHTGEKETTYKCQHCGATKVEKTVIPKKERSSGSSGGSSGGGSFGGGSSGGGGYSGRW